MLETTSTLQTKVKLGPDGRIVIPADIRQYADIRPGEELFIDVDNKGIRIRTLQQAIAEAQAFFTHDMAPDVSVSDALIAERRAEAKRD